MKEKTPWQQVLDSIPRKKEKPGWDTFAIKATAYALSLPISGTINLGLRLWDEARNFPGTQPEPLPPRPVSDKFEGYEQRLKDGLPNAIEIINKQISEETGEDINVAVPPPEFVDAYRDIIDEVFALCNPQTLRKQEALIDALVTAFYHFAANLPKPSSSFFLAPLGEAYPIDPWLFIDPFLHPTRRETGAAKKLEEYLERHLVNGVPTRSPFDPLSKILVPFDLTSEKRKHWCVFANTGGGKTSLLASTVISHLAEPDPPAMVIVDPHADLIRQLESLDYWRGNDRLTVIDPSSAPALNLFGIDDDEARHQILSLYAYIFSTEGADFSSRMSTLFSYMIAVLLIKHKEEGATILDILDLVDEPIKPGKHTESRYWKYIQKLDRVGQAFFISRFYGQGSTASKDAISTRLHTILRDDTLKAMFSARENKLNLYHLLHYRKHTVLVSSKGLGEGASTFLRFIVMLCMQIAFKRASVPEHMRHPILLFIDEAQLVLQGPQVINRILTETRKFGLFVRTFTQQISMLSSDIAPVLLGQTDVKLIGSPTQSDASALAKEMRCTPEYLYIDQPPTHLQYSCFIRGITPKPIRLSLARGLIDKFPKLPSDFYQVRYDALRDCLRESVAPFTPGERVQVTLNGADQYPAGVVVREVREHEGEWFVFVEDSATGIPAKDVRLFSATTDRTEAEKENPAQAGSGILSPAQAAQPFKPDEDFR